jgi:hypothetical protein
MISEIEDVVALKNPSLVALDRNLNGRIGSLKWRSQKWISNLKGTRWQMRDGPVYRAISRFIAQWTGLSRDTLIYAVREGVWRDKWSDQILRDCTELSSPITEMGEHELREICTEMYDISGDVDTYWETRQTRANDMSRGIPSEIFPSLRFLTPRNIMIA